MRRYNSLLIDVMNIAYRVFNHRQEAPTRVAKKSVYKTAVCNFIRAIERLRETYLFSDGTTYLLFDNPTSRIDLQTSFFFASRKSIYAKYKQDRVKEPKEFYNSIGLLRYYYLLQSEAYRTIQLSNLEADDLVKPLLSFVDREDLYHLLVSNDLDWARYISNNVHWLPQMTGEPDTPETVSQRLGFKVTEMSLISYKALFGDQADHIPSVLSASHEESFNEILLQETIHSPEEFITLSNSNASVKRYPWLLDLREKEKQYRINLQLVKEIPVAERHVEATLTTGRNATVPRLAVEKAIGLIESNEFVFGDIKRPRVTA